MTFGDLPRTMNLYLKPGGLVVADRPFLVTTILGSCVAVTLYNQRSGLGAICHAMLPEGSSSADFKFVDKAVGHMVNWFRGKGIANSEIEAKLFGGAVMFSGSGDPKRQINVGMANVQMALNMLLSAGIPLVAKDIGGRRGRKILFMSNTGEVLLKRLGVDEE